MSGDNDLLERATRALRAVPPPTDEELAAGRARLLAAQTKVRGKNPARTLRWVLPLAAVLVAGSALAATTGQVERMMRAVSSLLQSEPPEHARKAKKKRALQPDAVARGAEAPLPPPLPVLPEPAPAAAPASRPDDAPVEARARAGDDATDSGVAQESEREAALEAERAARRSARRRARSEAREAEPKAADEVEAASEPEQPSAPAAVPDADLARYREAHRLHFRARDFAAALRAWDAYLSAFPNGVFAIEARYNRAICLVRLGRKDEARRALGPFARGEVGRGYRKADATKLLEALE